LDATPVVTNAAPIDCTRAQRTVLGKIKVTRRHGELIARVRVSCPAGETGGCRTTLTLETAKRVRVGKVRAVLVLGSKRVTLRHGQSATISIRLARGAAAPAG